MVLLLRDSEVRQLMLFPEYVAAVEEGYRAVALGRGANLVRQAFWIEEGLRVSFGHMNVASPSMAAFKFKAALLSTLEGAGISAYTEGTPGGMRSYIFLFDMRRGGLTAVIESEYLNLLKTGATAALATRYLAPPASSIVAIFGTGRHARTQLLALCSVLKVARAWVYGRDRGRREKFAMEMSSEFGIEIVPAESPIDAVRDADVITTITTSLVPVFDCEMLGDRPVHINAMGGHYPAREIDEHVVIRSRIFLDEGRNGLNEKGEIAVLIEEGFVDASIVSGDLADVVSGRVIGRTSGAEWTLFLSGGTGIEDVAAAVRLTEIAKRRGVGVDVEFGGQFGS